MEREVRINPLVEKVMNERKERNNPSRENRFLSEIYRRPFFECVKMEMQEDFALADFFGKLDNYVERARKAEGREYVDNAKKKAEEVSKIAEKQAKLGARIKAAGITMLEFKNGYRLSDLGIEKDGYKSIDYSYTYIFSGLKLSQEMLRNPNDTTFEDKLKAEEEKNVERQEEVERLKQEYNRKRLSGLFTRKGRMELSDLKGKIGSLEYAIECIDKYKKDLAIWNGFSDEEKKLMADYMDLSDEMNKGIHEITQLSKDFYASLPGRDDPAMIHTALGRMVEDGMSEDELKTVFEKIEAVELKREAGVYGRRYMSREREDTIIDGFVMTVYDVDGKLKEEKENEKAKEKEGRE